MKQLLPDELMSFDSIDSWIAHSRALYAQLNSARALIRTLGADLTPAIVDHLQKMQRACDEVARNAELLKDDLEKLIVKK